MERTEDVEFICSIALHPRVWPRISCDGITDYQPTIHPKVHYLTDGDGWFCWRPLTTVAWEGHIAYLGKDAELFASCACEWALTHGAQKLVIMPPRYNWHAIKLAEKLGFQREGVLTNAVQWRGRLHDLIIMGLSNG
jgi:hypothetical protein